MLSERVYLPWSKPCFVCGEDNSSGLQTRFYVEDEMVKADLTATARHCGYRDVVHGGVVASLLDECMGWAAARVVKRLCFTGELTLRYRRPVPPDACTRAEAWVTQSSKRLVYAEGRIVDTAGIQYVLGKGRFVPLSVEETREVDQHLVYDANTERIFANLGET